MPFARAQDARAGAETRPATATAPKPSVAIASEPPKSPNPHPGRSLPIPSVIPSVSSLPPTFQSSSSSSFPSILSCSGSGSGSGSGSQSGSTGRTGQSPSPSSSSRRSSTSSTNSWLPDGDHANCLCCQTLTLPDGRTLGFSECGRRDGFPVFFFHGYPGDRLWGLPLDHQATMLGLRIISPERPGFGLSSPQPGRRILDWPADVLALARHLGLERFAVLGCSGGGPYAIACARELSPDVLAAVGVFIGFGPTKVAAGVLRLPWAVLAQGILARCAPKANLWMLKWLHRLVLHRKVQKLVYWVVLRKERATARNKKESRVQERRKSVVKTGPAVASGGAEKEKGEKEAESETRVPAKGTGKGKKRRWEKGEKVQLSKAEDDRVKDFSRYFVRLYAKLWKRDAEGMAAEMNLLARDWGFKLEDVTYDNVKLWHGLEDANCPIQMARYTADRLPHANLSGFKGEDHLSMNKYLHNGRVLRELVEGIVRDASELEKLRELVENIVRDTSESEISGVDEEAGAQGSEKSDVKDIKEAKANNSEEAVGA